MASRIEAVPDNSDKVQAADTFCRAPSGHAPWQSAAFSRIVISAQRLKMQTAVR
jgi:hypothetical protein